MLSVVTNKDQITRSLVRRVEDAGYRLTAVTIDQGSPVAWFKRTASKTKSSKSLHSADAEGADDLEPVTLETEDAAEPDSEVVESSGDRQE